MIRNIVFDLGGVVIIQKPTLWNDIFSDVFGTKAPDVNDVWDLYYGDLLEGKITESDILSRIIKTTGVGGTVETLEDKILKKYTSSTKINRPLLNIVSGLKREYNVYLLTDTIDLCSRINGGRGIYGKFDGIFESFRCGYSKFNGGKLYEFLFSEVASRPGECLFIDDSKEYIDLVMGLGGHGILFLENKTLIMDFQKMGIGIDSSSIQKV